MNHRLTRLKLNKKKGKDANGFKPRGQPQFNFKEEITNAYSTQYRCD